MSSMIRSEQFQRMLKMAIVLLCIVMMSACTNSGPEELIDEHYWGPPGSREVKIEWVWLRTNATIKSDGYTDVLCIAKGVITNLADKDIKVRRAILVLTGLYDVELYEMNSNLDVTLIPDETYIFHLRDYIHGGLITDVKSLSGRLGYDIL